MSRSGYSDDCDGPALQLWRGAVASAIRGKRGQALLKEMAAALDAMPAKELVRNELEIDGKYCALGAVRKSRGLSFGFIEGWEYEEIAKELGISKSLTQEIMWINDDAAGCTQTPEARWRWVRAWIKEQIKP